MLNVIPTVIQDSSNIRGRKTCYSDCFYDTLRIGRIIFAISRLYKSENALCSDLPFLYLLYIQTFVFQKP